MASLKIEHIDAGTVNDYYKATGYAIEGNELVLVERKITKDDIRWMARQVLAKMPAEETVSFSDYEKVPIVEEQVKDLVNRVRWNLVSDYTSKRESAYAYHARICVYLLIKYHLKLLSPVYGFGKKWNLNMEGVQPPAHEPPAYQVELPDDILYHIGTHLDNPKNLSQMSITKQAMTKRLNVDYFKFVDILPGQVFHRAHLSYLASTDPAEKEMLFTAMKTAIEYGAISSIMVRKTDYLYTIWKDVDQRVANLLIVEIFNFHTMKMYNSSDVQFIRSDRLPISIYEVREAMEYYGRLDLLSKNMIDKDPHYHFTETRMYGAEKIPDLELLRSFQTKMLQRHSDLLKSIEDRKITVFYHARLIVDLVKKGLVDIIEIPYTSDTLHICRGMRELPDDDKKLILPLFDKQVLARFILYGDNREEVKPLFKENYKLLVRHGYIPTEDDISALGSLVIKIKHKNIIPEKKVKDVFDNVIKVSDTRFLAYYELELHAFNKIGKYYYEDELRHNDHFLALKRLVDKGKEIEKGKILMKTLLYNLQSYDPEYPDMSLYKTINEEVLSALLDSKEEKVTSGTNLYREQETIYSQMDFLTPMIPQYMVDSIIKKYFSKGGYYYFF